MTTKPLYDGHVASFIYYTVVNTVFMQYEHTFNYKNIIYLYKSMSYIMVPMAGLEPARGYPH